MEKAAAYAYTGMYAIFLVAFIALALVSAGEEVPPFARDPPAFWPLRRMACFLYRKLREYREARIRAGKDLFVPGEEGVSRDLSVLYPSLKARRQEDLYRLRKIERLLLAAFAGVLLAGGVHVRSLFSGVLGEDGSVSRAPVGGPERQLVVRALPAAEGAEQEEEEKDYGTYSVTVQPRQYTRLEAAARARQILQQFPQALLGDNAAADQIRAPLRIPSAQEAEPFSLSWESSRYAVLDSDGSIFNSDYSAEQAEEVELTAVLSYGDYQFRKKMAFVVRAPAWDESQLLSRKIGEALRSGERETAESGRFPLPSSAGGKALAWQEQVEDASAGILVLGAAACILFWYVMDYRLHEKTRARNRQLAIDYPQFISRLVLYLGAGMSVRNVFYRCAAQYRAGAGTGAGPAGRGEAKKARREAPRWLYEEILLVCNELDGGIPEAEAYMHFGNRCRSRQYTKLCTLLVQNLRRGNDALLQVLQEEAKSSFEERKNLARELGEEAGTKLLLPMMLLLGITMLIIIVPAYFSFSM